MSYNREQFCLNMELTGKYYPKIMEQFSSILNKDHYEKWRKAMESQGRKLSKEIDSERFKGMQVQRYNTVCTVVMCIRMLMKGKNRISLVLDFDQPHFYLTLALLDKNQEIYEYFKTTISQEDFDYMVSQEYYSISQMK